MTDPSDQHEPAFTVIGGGEPTYELLEALADLLLDMAERQEVRDDNRHRVEVAGTEGTSVTVDAIPPDSLRDLARRCIEHHVDEDALSQMQSVEAAERDTLKTIVNNLERT